MTNRIVLLAALSEGISGIENVLVSYNVMAGICQPSYCRREKNIDH